MKREVRYFEITNYEEVDKRDLNAIQKLEEGVAAIGALPARIDTPSRAFCVTIEDGKPTDDQIIAVAESIGYHIRTAPESSKNIIRSVMENNTKNIKIVIMSLIFYGVGIVITFGILKLWFWLFSSNFWRIVFVVITLFGAMKYFWQHTDWIIKKFRKEI